MKIIKYNWRNWYFDFKPSDLDYFLVDLFKNDEDIKLVLSDNPDYLIYGVYGDYLKNASIDSFDIVKILYAVEPISPDFQFFDYCIGFEPYSFGNRYEYYPFFICFLNDHYNLISKEHAYSLLQKKDLFCNFIFSHDGVDVSRKKYFDLLSNYKKVDSAGTYLNNQGDHKVVSYMESSKVSFQSRCKFSLCIQSTNIDWFFNEEIADAINANTIPIFYGSESIKKIFNPKRFIFVGDYKSDDDLLNKIKEIDQNDELFVQIITEPIFVDQDFLINVKTKLKQFFKNIFLSENPKILKNKFVVRRNIARYVENSRRLNKLNKFLRIIHPFRKY